MRAPMGRLTRTGDDAGMPIHDWPEQERPREKLIARGPATLSDAELLALFLGSGFGGRDAVQTARDLLQAHGAARAAGPPGPGAGPAAWAGPGAQLCPGRRAGTGPALPGCRAAAGRGGRQQSRRGGSLPAAPPARAGPRDLHGAVPRQPPPPDRLRGAVPGHHQRRAGLSPRGGAARPAAQRGGGDPQPQPPLRRPGALRRRHPHHRRTAAGAGPGGRAPAGPLRGRRGPPVSFAERGLLSPPQPRLFG